MITSLTKKSDTLKPAHNSNANAHADITIGGDNPNTFFLFSPTARRMPRKVTTAGLRAHTPHTRNQSTIWYTGYQERMELSSTISYIWRRVVFWTHHRIPEAVGPQKIPAQEDIQHYYTRQMTPLTNTAQFRQFMFQGADGIDYNTSTLHLAPMNKRNMKIVMDKTYRINELNNRLTTKKHFFRGGKIIYDEHEIGSGVDDTSYWSTADIQNSKGNLYVFDIFSDGGLLSTTQVAGQFMCQGKSYWKES